ncbi:hypothetical protein DMENIID0001_035590 [Sergentomyia squamirostris]
MDNNTSDGTTPLGTSATQLSDPGPHQRVRVRRFPGANTIRQANYTVEKVRVASWNVGSMTSKSEELEDVMKRRRIDILCVQETKWRNDRVDRARFLTSTHTYKLYYYGVSNDRNGVGIILSSALQRNIVSTLKISDRLMSIKLVVCGRVWNVISAYAPQVGLTQGEKDAFWNDVETLLQDIPDTELVFLGGDLNGHVGESNHDYEDCHGGRGSQSSVRNDEGEVILSMARAHGMVILNTWFIKQQRHLITYSSGAHATQIDYHLCHNFMKRWVKNCKVILGESAVTQHRLLLTEFILKGNTRAKRASRPVEKIKWHNLSNKDHEHAVSPFILEMAEWIRGNTNCEDLSPTQMWNALSDVLVDKAKTTLGVSKGPLHNDKETWWWNSETKEAVLAKSNAFKAWTGCKPSSEKVHLKEKYDDCKKVVKRKVAQAQAAAAEKFYQELEDLGTDERPSMHEKPKDNARIYKVAAQRRRNAREIQAPKYIEDAHGTLLVDDKAICNRMREYFNDLLNEEFPRESFPSVEPNTEDIDDFSVEEVMEAMKQMKRGKAVGPDQIPLEFWLKMNIVGLKWLTVLFNKMKSGQPMPEAFRKSFLLPFYKNKGDSRKLNNYRAIKLTPHTLKIYERVICNRLNKIVRLSDNQCGFVEGRSTSDAIQCLRTIMEKHRDAREDWHLVFIDFEKAFDRVPRDLIWVALRALEVPEAYVKMIMDMYDGAITKVRCTAGESEEFPIKVGVHQGSVLSPLLFNIIMFFLLSLIHDDLELSLLFADDVVLGSRSIVALQDALTRWCGVVEGHGLRISIPKTEYMFCPFSDPTRPTPGLYINGVQLGTCTKFKYLGSVVNNDATCEDDVNHRISVGWMKWRENSGVFCDKKMPRKLKGRLYKTVVRPALTYGSECWTMYKKYESKLTATEMKMLRMSAGVTKLDHIKSTFIRGSLFVENPILEKLEDRRMDWYCHVQRRPPENPAKKAYLMDVPQSGPKQGGRRKNNWISQMQQHQHRIGLSEGEIQDRAACKRKLGAYRQGGRIAYTAGRVTRQSQRAVINTAR